jgi:hypothetical protein
MGDIKHHARIAKEKKEAAIDKFKKERFTVVGDLVLKAGEQAIEAAAALSGKHFHVDPRSAHARRVTWIKKNFPQLSGDIDIIWGAYGDLGCNGLNGKRAKDAIMAMERILNAISKQTRIQFR